MFSQQRGSGPSSSYGAVASPSRVWEWEARGFPWKLSLQVVLLLGRQTVTLALIVYSVVQSDGCLMSCDPRRFGHPASWACEYSKAYVRCFPLVAIVVCLLIACRVYLYLRVYYRLLKRSILIKFDEFHPLSDPLFQILIFCISQAFFHFLLNFWTSYSLTGNVVQDIYKMSADQFQKQASEVMVFYMVPAALFFGSLYASYDVSEMVLPFSKFFSEDTGVALQSVSDMFIVPEGYAMLVVQEDIIGGLPTPVSTDEVFAEFSKRAKEMESARRAGGQSPPTLSRWRLTATWWPARLLLDPRLTDEESSSFRRVWYLFSLLVVASVLFAIRFTCKVLKDKIDGVREGQTEDVAGFVVALVFTGMILVVAHELCVKALLRPFLGYTYSPAPAPK